MTTPRDPDEILAAWLDDGPHRLPDQTRRAIAVAIPTTTQRRRGLLAPWRRSLMSPLARTAAAVLVVAVVAGGALFLLKPSGGVASPNGSPSPSNGGAACTKSMANGIPLLDKGCTYTSTTQPAFSVTGVPSAYVGNVTPRGTELRVRVPSMAPTDEPGTLRVIAVDNVMTTPCNNDFAYNENQPTGPWPSGADASATAFFAWLGDNTPLPVETQPVTIGGHDGLQATFALEAGFLSDCGGGPGSVFVTDYGSTAPGSALACGAHKGTCELWIEDGAMQTRLAGVDVDGKLVLVAVKATDATFDEVLAEADKLIATMQFE